MILLLQFLSLWLAHDIHLTKAQVEFNQADQAVQVSMHIFLDDLETVIKDETGFVDKMHLGTEKEVAVGDSLLVAYLSNHFTVTVNEQPLVLSFLGKENSEDLLAVWCYFEFPVPKGTIAQVTLTNDVLTELYDDQQNIVSLKGPDRKMDYLLFKKGETTSQFTY